MDSPVIVYSSVQVIFKGGNEESFAFALSNEMFRRLIIIGTNLNRNSVLIKLTAVYAQAIGATNVSVNNRVLDTQAVRSLTRMVNS